LGSEDTATVLGIALSRIYTLRNQLVSGGATWGSKINREQIRDCVNLMGKLVPVILTIMMDYPNALWARCLLSGCGGMRDVLLYRS
jgi:hypothetical protein